MEKYADEGDAFTEFKRAHRTFMREKTVDAFSKVQQQWETFFGEPEFGIRSTGDRIKVERMTIATVKGAEDEVLSLLDKLENTPKSPKCS